MKIVKEFKAFINKGNIMDLAVAVIIGSAFGKIITSLTKDILTPILSLILGQEGFTNYKYVITAANPDLGIQENAIYYGNFIQNSLDFLLTAIVIFLIIKIYRKAKELSEDVVEDTKSAIKGVTKTDDLLKDIKTLLADNLNNNN